MIFAAGNLTQAVSLVSGMFGGKGMPLSSAEFIYQLRNYGFVLIIAIFGATPIPKKCALCSSPREPRAPARALCVALLFEKCRAKFVLDIAEMLLLLILLVVSTAYLADGSFNPFLYFRF